MALKTKTRSVAMLVATGFLAMCLSCTVMTQEQKDWISLKAERSEDYVVEMDAGRTTRAQDQAKVRIDAISWRLSADKGNLGLAWPSWMAKPDVPVQEVE